MQEGHVGFPWNKTRTWLIRARMNEIGDLISLSVGINDNEPLLYYNKELRDKHAFGMAGSSDVIHFLQQMSNFPQVARVFMALDNLGIDGIADGLNESAAEFERLLQTCLKEQNSEGT